VKRNGHGSLVLVGSTAGIFGEAGHADYAAAKSAVVRGLLLSLKNEVGRIAPRGRVNARASTTRACSSGRRARWRSRRRPSPKTSRARWSRSSPTRSRAT
jgi:NAD(P)-dependent dehydrogenase (short-subunit alcohol dehydrogenase family)